MILVTGSTGTVGAAVVRALGTDAPVRILTRRPELAPAGVEVQPGEYADHDALLRALTGIRAAFLVTNSPVEPDDERFTAAAREAGVRHLVKLSALAVADEGADDFITRRQRHNEEVIRGSGLSWTLLRPRAFMSNTLAWAPSIRAHGVVRALYGTAPTACVDPRDIAEVAARALTEPGHEGRTYALTGPEPITPEEQTRQLAEALGRPLRFAELTPEQALGQLGSRYPEPVARALVESAGRTAAGVKAEVSPDAEKVTGRAARDFRAWLPTMCGRLRGEGAGEAGLRCRAPGDGRAPSRGAGLCRCVAPPRGHDQPQRAGTGRHGPARAGSGSEAAPASAEVRGSPGIRAGSEAAPASAGGRGRPRHPRGVQGGRRSRSPLGGVEGRQPLMGASPARAEPRAWRRDG